LLYIDSRSEVMAAGVAITRTDLDAGGLRRAAAQSRDADAARRMRLAVHSALFGGIGSGAPVQHQR
jgi:hypothetical protein